MSSGVSVSAESKTVYEEVKQGKKYRYIIYHIKDMTTIQVESTGPRDATYAQFLVELEKKKDQCRYCVFDFPAEVSVEGGAGDKTSMCVDRLVMMTWCPEEANVKQKMLYTSSYNALKKALVGIYKYVQACDMDEASQASIENVFKKGN